jgi:hypothetical protein
MLQTGFLRFFAKRKSPTFKNRTFIFVHFLKVDHFLFVKKNRGRYTWEKPPLHRSFPPTLTTNAVGSMVGLGAMQRTDAVASAQNGNHMQWPGKIESGMALCYACIEAILLESPDHEYVFQNRQPTNLGGDGGPVLVSTPREGKPSGSGRHQIPNSGSSAVPVLVAAEETATGRVGYAELAHSRDYSNQTYPGKPTSGNEPADGG